MRGPKRKGETRMGDMLAGRVAGIEGIGPWLWDIGGRHYAVYGLAFRRKPATA